VPDSCIRMHTQILHNTSAYSILNTATLNKAAVVLLCWRARAIVDK